MAVNELGILSIAVKYIPFIFFFLHIQLYAQDFINNNLEDTLPGASRLPDGWQSVPFTDVNCNATDFNRATTDLICSFPCYSTIANPYSGITFVSGLMLRTAPGIFYQEGIMQTVSGFEIDNSYSVHFYQSVVKQNNSEDTSGSWAVYIDDDLLGISPATISNEPLNSTSLKWEFNSFSFSASSDTHTIKFLPYDDDSDNGPDNPLGGLRMGIDSIYISSIPNKKCPVYFPNAFSPNGDNVNDIFLPKYSCALNEFEFSIFNRWGEKIFDTSDPLGFWNGDINDVQAPVGIYTYLLKYNNGDPITKRGRLSLIR